MRASTWILLLGVILSGVVNATKKTRVTLESSHSLPPGWRMHRPARGDENLTISIALRQPKLDSLRDMMLKVSDAGHHLSQTELQNYQQPAQDAVQAVHKWLSKNGMTGFRDVEGWIILNTTVDGVKSLFEADLAYFAFEKDAPQLRTQSYSIPSYLEHYIDFVYPLALFMNPARPHHPLLPKSNRNFADSSKNANTTCATNSVTPACLMKLYNWCELSASRDSPSRLGVAGFLDEFINYEDVANFTGMFAPYLDNLSPPYNFTVRLVANGTNPQLPRWGAGEEASLDVEWAMALAYPSQITYFSTGGRGVRLDGQGLPVPHSDNEPYLDLLEHLLALPDSEIPQTLSISYSDDEQSVPAAYARRVCDLFLQLAARGVSVLVASGDGGSGGIGRERCVSNDGAGRPGLLPTFPASCPWVTAVGATDNDPLSRAADYSSGGFSNLFSRPNWQDAAVQRYIAALGGKKEGLYNASGRGIPDISAVGTGFAVIVGGGPTELIGTSAATPVIASMVALVNDLRLRQGKSSIGWLNSKLYAAGFPALLEDIQNGTSRPCRINSTYREPGWPATPGWDAVTGLGVPRDMRSFLDSLVSLP